MSLRTRSQKVQEAFLFGKRDHFQERPSLDERWEERELFFWTAFKGIRLAVTLALAVYLIVCLVSGTSPPIWLSLK
jgi:hypothetical protein